MLAVKGVPCPPDPVIALPEGFRRRPAVLWLPPVMETTLRPQLTPTHTAAGRNAPPPSPASEDGLQGNLRRQNKTYRYSGPGTCRILAGAVHHSTAGWQTVWISAAGITVVFIVAQELILCTGGSYRCSQVSPGLPSSPHATPADSSTSPKHGAGSIITLILGCRICLLQCVLKNGTREGTRHEKAVQNSTPPIQKGLYCIH